MPNSKLVKSKTLQELKDSVNALSTGFDPGYVLKKAEEEIKTLHKGDPFGPETNLYKSMTLFEFEKGILIASSVPDRFRVFALDFSRKLQQENDCKTQSEKSLAEVISLNYVRVLSIQDKITSYLSKSEVTDIGVGYLNVMSKELDRAQRHYFTALQTLKMFKTPPLEVNIRTQTAVVGQNQIVQANNK